MSDDKGSSTQLIHHPYQPPAGFMAPQPGVFKASTVIFPNVAALQARNWKEKTGYTYGLHGTPTTFLLEERIATLEGGAHTLLVPSGLAAITLVDMALLKQRRRGADPRQRLRAGQGTGAPGAVALGHHAPLLRPGRRRRRWRR